MSDNTITIRRAHKADLAGMAGLLRILFNIEADFAFDEELQRKGLAMMLQNPLGCVLVAVNGSGVVGMCTGQLTISTAEGGPAVLVEDVVVLEEWRGKGIGRRLMDSIARWGAKQGAARLQLLADKINTQGLEFYKKLGWETTRLICLRKRFGE